MVQVSDEIELLKRELRRDLEDNLSDWAKRRFWWLGILAILGISGVVHLTMSSMVGDAENKARDAATRATFAAERAADATEQAESEIKELGSSIAQAKDSIRHTEKASRKAELKAQEAAKSAEKAQETAVEAETQAQRASEATRLAEAAIETISEKKIEQLNLKFMALEKDANTLLSKFNESDENVIKLKAKQLEIVKSTRSVYGVFQGSCRV